jgi:hypothetical protein
MQRTGAKILVALIAEALIFALLVGFGEQSRADRQREAIAEFTTLIDAALGRAPEAVQLRAAEATILPELASMVAGLQAGDPPPPDTDELAEGWSSQLKGAADRVLEATTEFEALDLEQRRVLADGRDLIDHGLRLFASLAEQFGVAANIEDEPRQNLADAMQDQIRSATTIFGTGYLKLQDLRLEAGLQPVIPPTTGGIPPGFDPTMPGFDPTMPGFDPTMPGFDPTMPAGGTQVVPAEPPGGQGDGGGEGGDGGGGGNG